MVKAMTPQWLVEEHHDMAIIMEVMEAELRENPNMLLADFFKNFNSVIMDESLRRTHKVVMSQFDKE